MGMIQNPGLHSAYSITLGTYARLRLHAVVSGSLIVIAFGKQDANIKRETPDLSLANNVRCFWVTQNVELCDRVDVSNPNGCATSKTRRRCMKKW